MLKSNILEEIESNYPVETIQTAEGMPVWPLLRQGIYYAQQFKEVGYSNKLRTRNKWQLLKNFFYGIPYLFQLKKFNYLFFNNADKRRPHNELWYDIFMDAWADKVGQEQSLFVEWAITSHHSAKEVHSKHVVSDLFLKLITFKNRLFSNIELKNEALIKEICADFEIPFNYSKTIRNSIAEIKSFYWFFSKVKPKAVFLLSGFTKVPMVLAAKKLNIPVLEPQHGFIGEGHPFYHAVKKFPDFYPDKLIAFGAFEKNRGYPSFIFEPANIVPIGSMQMELIKEEILSETLVEIKSNFSICYCVTLQNIQDKAIMEMINKEAVKHRDWLFVIRPKQPNFDLSLYSNEENIKIFPNHSIYEILKMCDYNITIFSTTVIEGIFLGAKPILINIDDLPYKYFDLNSGDVAVLELGEVILNAHLNKSGTLETEYFKEHYFSNVKEANLCS